MDEIVKKNWWAFKQFTIINRTAQQVYSAVQGGVDLNFYGCYCEYENGRFGFIKESRSLSVAIEIYDNITANEGWEIINQVDAELDGKLSETPVETILEWEKQLAEYS
jgi:hypothetical protein